MLWWSPGSQKTVPALGSPCAEAVGLLNSAPAARLSALCPWHCRASLRGQSWTPLSGTKADYRADRDRDIETEGQRPRETERREVPEGGRQCPSPLLPKPTQNAFLRQEKGKVGRLLKLGGKVTKTFILFRGRRRRSMSRSSQTRSQKRCPSSRNHTCWKVKGASRISDLERGGREGV